MEVYPYSFNRFMDVTYKDPTTAGLPQSRKSQGNQGIRNLLATAVFIKYTFSVQREMVSKNFLMRLSRHISLLIWGFS